MNFTDTCHIPQREFDRAQARAKRWIVDWLRKNGHREAIVDHIGIVWVDGAAGIDGIVPEFWSYYDRTRSHKDNTIGSTLSGEHDEVIDRAISELPHIREFVRVWIKTTD